MTRASANKRADKPQKAITRPTLSNFEFNELFQNIRRINAVKNREFLGTGPLFLRN
jgi:hypothetical protein